MKIEEIEITPRMIEVGMHEYATRWIGLRDADDEIAKEMLAAAYRAMFRLRATPEVTGKPQIPLPDL